MGGTPLSVDKDYNWPTMEPDEWHFPINPNTWVDDSMVDECAPGMARPITTKLDWNWFEAVGMQADWLVEEYAELQSRSDMDLS